MPNTKRMIDDFVRYTKVDTASDPESKSFPSTKGQLELARIVADDLRKAGAANVELDEGGFIYATIEENIPAGNPAKGKVPTIGFLAHLDTSADAPGKDVKVRFIDNYRGGDITYPANPEVKLDATNAAHLANCIGHTIITTDGTTLLGGDDKAAIAILCELVRHYKENPSDMHGKIRIAIIPDEEIGVGTEKLDLKKFGCDVAYTLDGSEMGAVDVETFNGFAGKVKVEGFPAFPGYGKGIYLNASQVLASFIEKMEDRRWPQNASGRDPIWWVNSLTGEVAKAEMTVYLRDFDLEGIEEMKRILNGVKENVLKKYPKAKIDVDIKETYKNYKYELEKDPRVLNYALEAIKNLGMEPSKQYVRGGNDACHLCFSGLISTNIFIGMQNQHSVTEWNTVETIEASLKTAIELAKVWVKHTVK